MKITNKKGLPAPLVRAVTQDDYFKGDADYSVTELIKPPRIAALEKKHDEELEEDASDLLYRLLGEAGHEVLRRSSQDGIVEERCIVEFGGKKISGQIDYGKSEQVIVDYKFTSMWAIKDGIKPEWEQQLNCYKWMAEQYGVEVKELVVVAILRDWSKPEAARNPDLPQSQVMVFKVRIWEKAHVETWVTNRLRLHEEARMGYLPDCTSEEMWARPATFAVMKKGNVRATKVCATQLEAGTFIAAQPKPTLYEIELRPEQRPRCELYCPVQKWCGQYQQWKGESK